MTCTVCGAEAAIKRDAAYYCGKCAVARDWGDVIAMVQDGPHGGGRVQFGAEDVEDTSSDDPASVPAAPVSDADPFAN